MIYKVSETKLDSLNLSRHQQQEVSLDECNYQGVIVKKPWGYEYLFFQNEFVGVWLLFIREGQSTSMHSHPNKKSSLIVLSGEIVAYTLGMLFKLKSLDGLLIDKSVFHCSKAGSDSSAVIMEVESPPVKRDIVRLKDIYGRAGRGYEGSESMTSDLDGYNYHCIDDLAFKTHTTLNVVDKKVTLSKISDRDALVSHINSNLGSVVVLLAGIIRDDKGNEILGVGDAVSVDEIAEYITGNISLDDQLICLMVS